ncbi:hypothetical protein HYFRA_00003906 [Hymenoscyphus fraxineus]|uniref:Uncharacterized protein n=1 Tax=Hymenoscyphus fraxineus TaxID=746836 RepID=A0A9N9KZ41_9HELO|nr:hypothetical protein HYFRA_00003906 [Hymenoscyphus fraxineus]
MAARKKHAEPKRCDRGTPISFRLRIWVGICAVHTAFPPAEVSGAAFSASTKLHDYEPVSEKEIAAVFFEQGSVKLSTLIVGENKIPHALLLSRKR